MSRFFFVHQLSDSILFSAIMSSRCLLPTSNVDTNWRFTFERNLLISIFTVSSFFRAKIYFFKIHKCQMSFSILIQSVSVDSKTHSHVKNDKWQYENNIKCLDLFVLHLWCDTIPAINENFYFTPHMHGVCRLFGS